MAGKSPGCSLQMPHSPASQPGQPQAALQLPPPLCPRLRLLMSVFVLSPTSPPHTEARIPHPTPDSAQPVTAASPVPQGAPTGKVYRHSLPQVLAKYVCTVKAKADPRLHFHQEPPSPWLPGPAKVSTPPFSFLLSEAAGCCSPLPPLLSWTSPGSAAVGTAEPGSGDVGGQCG